MRLDTSIEFQIISKISRRILSQSMNSPQHCVVRYRWTRYLPNLIFRVCVPASLQLGYGWDLTKCLFLWYTRHLSLTWHLLSSGLGSLLSTGSFLRDLNFDFRWPIRCLDVDLLLLLVTVCLSYSLDGVCLVVVSDLIWIALTSLPRQALTAFAISSIWSSFFLTSLITLNTMRPLNNESARSPYLVPHRCHEVC